MKRLLLSCFALLVVVTLSAQSYHNGVWYSLYDDELHTMNTQGDYAAGGVFAPTAGTLNVRWQYEWIDWLGFARKIDTEVLESSDNGASTHKVGSLAENTDNSSQTDETFSVGADINWIKFNRSGVPTHKVNIRHLDIRLAKHILLESGDYGKTIELREFGEVEALTVSGPQRIRLRSFLTAGDITVTSSLPDIFRIGAPDNTEPLHYVVGAGACASANGTAPAASGGTLGNIDNYAFDVYFTPQEGREYAAVITVTDGTSKATVSVSGRGRKKSQVIRWEQEEMVSSAATIGLAEASSGLPVEYLITPEGVVDYAGGVFSILAVGKVRITASQAGNAVYEAAEPVVRDITIFPAETRYDYSAAVCKGTVYSDGRFEGLTEAGLYYDTIANVYGSDSVICLSLTLDSVYAFEEIRTMYVGEEETWQDIDLAALPLGDTTLVAEYVSVSGCDSVHTLRLHVISRPTTYGSLTIHLCEGETAEYEGNTYDVGTEKSVLLAAKNQFGGDSVVEMKVLGHPLFSSEEERTIRKGEKETWQNRDLSMMPVGDTTLVADYVSVYGCDSVYTLRLKVLALPTTYGADTLNICAGEKVTYEGRTYKRPCTDSVLVSTPNRFGGDSVVVLAVYVRPNMRLSANKTITAGETAEWQHFDLSAFPVGDTTLVAEYTSVYGCDSVYTLHLVVMGKTPAATDRVRSSEHEGARKIFMNGHVYIRRDEWLYDLTGKRVHLH